MPFIAPFYLLGTTAASIPVIIHMIHKRKAQKILFPTIRFLKSSNERTARRQRIQDLLLLLLRMLLLILLAVALAQPFIGERHLGLGERVHAIILLDNSYSMGTTHEGESRLAAGKRLADAAVDALPEGSEAAIVLSCPPAGHPAPLLTDDHEELRRQILSAPLSCDRADMTAAVQRAYDLLADDPSPSMEIYAVTDLQRNAWTPRPKGDERPRSGAPQPSLLVIDCGRDDYRNVAISELAVHSGSRVRSRPIAIQADIQNYSRDPQTVNVTLHINGKKEDNRELTLKGEQVTPVTFHHTFTEPGTKTGRVGIDPDSLEADNQRHFCIDVRDDIPVAIFRTGSPQPGLDPAFCVSKALEPPRSGLAGELRSPVRTTLATLEQLSDEYLKQFAALFLVDAEALADKQIAALAHYVRAGGNLFVLCGPNVQPDALNRLLHAGPDGEHLMPVTVGAARYGIVDRSKATKLTIRDYAHPALRVFADYPLDKSVRVYNAAPVEIDRDSPAQTRIILSDGRPFLLENRVQKGSVFLFTSGTDPDWSNLAGSRFFLPLLHQLVYHATERRDVESSHIVGADVAIRFPGLDDIRAYVVEPDDAYEKDEQGEPVYLAADTVGGVLKATFNRTDKAGPYRIVRSGAEARRAFVVNVDTDESELAKMPPKELTELLEGRSVYFAKDKEELDGAIQLMRKGVPLRDFVLYAVLFIAIFECFFANRVIPALQKAQEERRASLPQAAPAEARPPTPRVAHSAKPQAHAERPEPITRRNSAM